MDSVIDPKYQSFIANDHEELIPQYPVQFTQNKKMVSIWYESKEVMNQTLRKHHLMTQEEREEAATVPELKQFFQETSKILERWMKVQTHENGDFVGTLVIDQLLKCILIKLDSVFTVKDIITEREHSDCKEKLKKFKIACKDKMELQILQYEDRRKEYEKKIQSLESTISTLNKSIDKMQVKFTEKELEFSTLISHDNRYENLAHLQDCFLQINEMISDHDSNRDK